MMVEFKFKNKCYLIVNHCKIYDPVSVNARYFLPIAAKFCTDIIVRTRFELIF